MIQRDKIGREDIVNKICTLVDSLEKDKHFCLALNGEWGSGKSFVMQMIEDKLSTHKEYIILKYDAWKNNFYSDPLVAILSCILDGIEDKLYLIERRKEKLSKAAKTAAKALTILSTKAEKINNIIEELKGVIKYFHNPVDMSVVENFKSYQMLLNETKSILNDILQVERYRAKQSKLIILVDEIDRCLPDEQLKVLERLHHLFDVKNCAVIVALNQKSVAKTVEKIYGIKGDEYISKFLDFNFTLTMSSAEYLKKLLDELSEKIKKINSKNNLDKAIFAGYDCLNYGHKKVLGNINNRDITRYYDSINNICNDFGWEILSGDAIFFIIIGLFIRRFISGEFLEINYLVEKQKTVSHNIMRDDMPYYDYILESIGMDRQNIPTEITNSKPFTEMPNLIWDFNEMVCFSINRSLYRSDLNMRYIRNNVSFDLCVKLRELVMLYGGDKIKDDKTANS